jgi:hypothetical protein
MQFYPISLKPLCDRRSEKILLFRLFGEFLEIRREFLSGEAEIAPVLSVFKMYPYATEPLNQWTSSVICPQAKSRILCPFDNL